VNLRIEQILQSRIDMTLKASYNPVYERQVSEGKAAVLHAAPFQSYVKRLAALVSDAASKGIKTNLPSITSHPGAAVSAGEVRLR
jgi:hypothetical protein